jgi:hypothetical protein
MSFSNPGSMAVRQATCTCAATAQHPRRVGDAVVGGGVVLVRAWGRPARLRKKVSVIGMLLLNEPLTAGKALGIALVIGGVVTLNLEGAH